MTAENTFPWAEEAACAVTVSDCHNERSRETIRRMLASGGTNAYTIEKQGVRKMIYQTAWKERGEIRGLVEISMELPAEIPHYIRK